MSFTHRPDRIPRAPDQAKTTYVSALSAGDTLKTFKTAQDLLHRRRQVDRPRSHAVDTALRSCPERHRSALIARVHSQHLDEQASRNHPFYRVVAPAGMALSPRTSVVGIAASGWPPTVRNTHQPASATTVSASITRETCSRRSTENNVMDSVYRQQPARPTGPSEQDERVVPSTESAKSSRP